MSIDPKQRDCISGFKLVVWCNNTQWQRLGYSFFDALPLLSTGSADIAEECFLTGVGDLMAKAAAATQGVNHLSLAWGFMREGTKLRPTGASNALYTRRRF